MERLHATNAIVMSGYMVSFSSLQPQFSHQNLFEEQFLTLPLCNVNLTPPSTQPPFSESIPHSEETPSHVLLLSAHLGKMAVSKWASCWCDPFLGCSLLLQQNPHKFRVG